MVQSCLIYTISWILDVYNYDTYYNVYICILNVMASKMSLCVMLGNNRNHIV